MIDSDSIFVQNSSVIAQQLQDEAVLLLPLTGEIKVLNEVGARIWTLIDGRRTVWQIAMVVHTEYQVAEAEAQADTLASVAELQERTMVFQLHT